MNASLAISAVDVSKSYRDILAIGGVTLDIHAGECVALVGPNGAGKSTFLKLCLDLIRPSAGTLNIFGWPTSSGRFNEMKKSLGCLPELVMFHGTMSGRETLRFYARLKGVDAAELAVLLERVDLIDAADRPVSTYSKGMRQRLGLAQALLGAPNLLLLDEPMSGLDPHARQNFFKILNEEKDRGAAIVLSSHILTELEARTDRVAIISQGQLRAIGSISDLGARLNLPAHIRVSANASGMQKLRDHFGTRFSAVHFANGVAALPCANDKKLELIRELMNSNVTFDKFDIVEPSLEQIFAAHTQTKGKS